ncbi:hypothetical protein CPT_Moby_106 [Stenotrophomonas phage Moby]|uniref:Uncharacterized protein n=1 Tax=Stenotrophomonas phage Moby TaxID=2601680 RepID=A0A5P8PME4_9CAUD|nr:hypothetical protein HWC58_gp271 [Stenotrophomonas phage Moby]QFR57852.1 hypothetical protein CPT_Moby_106 [Stenotrophomonas phage Moby]
MQMNRNEQTTGQATDLISAKALNVAANDDSYTVRIAA